MSRHTVNKHGIIVGWDNFWFFWDENDIHRDGFRSILWCKGYNHTRINTLNYSIRTPAQQLLYTPERVIKPYIQGILTNNYSDRWATEPPRAGDGYHFTSLFFNKVSDARHFRGWIETQLEGFPASYSKKRQ